MKLKLDRSGCRTMAEIEAAVVDVDDAVVTAFLDELTELTKKHGITIHGCGCCDSPLLSARVHEGDHYTTCDGTDLRWEFDSDD